MIARPSRSHREIALLAVVTAIAAAIRFTSLGAQSLWLDEIFEVTAATSGTLRSAAFFESNHPPLHRLLLALWIDAFGRSEAAIRALEALIGTATVPALFLWADRALGRRTALFAAAVAAASPYLVTFSQEARGYALLILLTTVSFACWVRWRGSAIARVGWTATAILGLHTHYFFVFPLLVQAIDVLGRRAAAPSFRSAAKGFAIAGAAFLPWALYAGQTLPEQGRGYVESLPNVPITLFRWSVGYGLWINDYRRSLLPDAEVTRQALPIAILAAAVFLPPFVTGVRRAWRAREDGGRLPIALIAVPIALLLALSPVVELLHPRYMAFAAPAFVLLVAHGLATARPPLRIAGLTFVLALSAAGIVAERSDPRAGKERWREVVARVEREASVRDVVLLDLHVTDEHVPFAWDHYATGVIDWRALPRPLPASKAELEVAVGDLDRYDRIWLVSSHAEAEGAAYRALLDRLFRRIGGFADETQWGIWTWTYRVSDD